MHSEQETAARDHQRAERDQPFGVAFGLQGGWVLGAPEVLLAVEDAAQVLNLYPGDKYRVSA